MNMNEPLKNHRDPFGLSELPVPTVPDQGWSAIESALQKTKTSRRHHYWIATAAAFVLAIGFYWQMPQSGDQGVLPSPGTVQVSTNTSLPSAPITKEANIDSLVKLSQQLERNLRVMRSEVDVRSGQALIYQVELEDMVAQVDEAINRQPGSKALWTQRVNLLQDLNQFYQQQLRRDVSQFASL